MRLWVAQETFPRPCTCWHVDQALAVLHPAWCTPLRSIMHHIWRRMLCDWSVRCEQPTASLLHTCHAFCNVHCAAAFCKAVLPQHCKQITHQQAPGLAAASLLRHTLPRLTRSLLLPLVPPQRRRHRGPHPHLRLPGLRAGVRARGGCPHSLRPEQHLCGGDGEGGWLQQGASRAQGMSAAAETKRHGEQYCINSVCASACCLCPAECIPCLHASHSCDR
jgi:hypothetical protein